MTYGDYTTVGNVRTSYFSSSVTTRDDVIADLITSTSREMDAICNRHFVPLQATHYYDAPRQSKFLYFDDDLIAITAMANGDGVAIAQADYRLYPLNSSPKNRLVMLMTSPTPFVAADGNYEGAITITGEWGDCNSDVWQLAGATIATTQTDTAATLIVTQNKIAAGDLLRVGSEYQYVTAVIPGATDTATVARAVNGSVAAAHNSGVATYRYVVAPEIEMVCRMAVAAYFRVKDNPVGETITIEGSSFATPKDVLQWMQKRLQTLGVVRVGIG